MRGRICHLVMVLRLDSTLREVRHRQLDLEFQQLKLEEKAQNATTTPWKINMEPTNHPFRKENDLPNLHDYVPC